MLNILNKVKSLTELGDVLVNYGTSPEDTLRSLLDVVTDEAKKIELNNLILGVRGTLTGPKAVNKGKIFIKEYISFILETVIKTIEESENGLYVKLTELDKKAIETETVMNIDEIILKQKHYSRDKLASEFMARKTLAYIKNVSEENEVGLYLPKLLEATKNIKKLDFTLLTNAIADYNKRTVYLKTNSKYVKTNDYYESMLVVTEPRFNSVSLEAYIAILNSKTNYVEANTKDEVLNALNNLIGLFKNIGVTIKDINTKVTSNISEYKDFNLLEQNIKDENNLLKEYNDGNVASEQFIIEYKNRINLILNSAISRLNVYNQAEDIINEAFLRYDYIVDIYTALTNITNNGKLGDPTKE